MYNYVFQGGLMWPGLLSNINELMKKILNSQPALNNCYNV